MDSFCKHIFPLINMYKTVCPGADLVGVCRGAHHHPPSLPSWDDLRISNATSILQNMEICMICILSSSHYIIRTLSSYDDDDDNVKKNNWFYEQNNCCARASRLSVHFFDIHCTTTTWILPMRRFMEEVGILRQIFPSLFEHGLSP